MTSVQFMVILSSSFMLLVETKSSCSRLPLTYNIKTTWDSQIIDHDPVKITLSAYEDGLHMKVEAPFFNDPANPGGTPGEPFDKLWDYEVVEAFFLNDKNQYLEVELSPHGQHLLLMLNGERNSFQERLPIEYSASITGENWSGIAIIPWDYFPPQVTKFNAYAIHGSDDSKGGRVYESLYPVPKGQFENPDFHRLSSFKEMSFKTLASVQWNKPASSFWKNIPKKSKTS